MPRFWRVNVSDTYVRDGVRYAHLIALNIDQYERYIVLEGLSI